MSGIRIVPRLDEVENGGFGITLRPESLINERLAYERGVDAFTHRIIAAVTTRTHRWSNACELATLREGDGRVLRRLIGVMNDCGRLDHALFAHMVSHRPADEATAKDIMNNGNI